MRVKRAADLSRELGIPRRTVNKWCKDDPELAYKDADGAYWIRLDRLAGRPGIDLVDAYLLGSSRWIKAAALARLGGIPRRTMAQWCHDRRGFAKRIGVEWYIDLEQYEVSPEDFLALLGQLGERRHEGE